MIHCPDDTFCKAAGGVIEVIPGIQLKDRVDAKLGIVSA